MHRHWSRIWVLGLVLPSTTNIFIVTDEEHRITLPLLQNELKSVANHYYLIGCYLNVNNEEISRITRQNRHNPLRCLNGILEWWFEHGESVSWKKVASVMDNLLRKDISVQILTKYCGVPTSQVCMG